MKWCDFVNTTAWRGPFERERSLLGLLSRTAYDAILKTYQALFGRTDVRPGCVTSIQTFGAFASNLQPSRPRHRDAMIANMNLRVTVSVRVPRSDFARLYPRSRKSLHWG